MISKNDFLEKRILYIANTVNFPNELKFKNSNICLYRNGKLLEQISCYLVNCVFIIGDHTITTQLLKNLNKFGISIFFLTQSFSLYSSFSPVGAGNYLLREKQYLLKDSEMFTLSKKIVLNKIVNQENILKKFGRPERLTDIAKLSACKKNASLLGIEGNASKNYFTTLFSDFNWKRRAPQTKEDEINLLLDMGYTFLFNYVDSLLQLFGFDTYKGIYHKLFFQRKSLSCDIMEPIRPIIDYSLIKAFHLRQINDNDFVFDNQMFSFKDYKIAQKYVNIFTKTIMDYNQEIYNFILSFYRYIFDIEQNKWKEFILC